MIDWQVGQHLVCIDTFNYAKTLGFNVPDLHGVYTIRFIGLCPVDQTLGVLLEEIRNRLNTKFKEEFQFECAAFRPVKPTSLDCFAHHLIRAPDLELTK